MKIRSALLLSSLLAIVPAVKAEAWIAQEYPVSKLEQIRVGGDASLELTQDGTEYLRVEADPEVMKRVKVDLTGNRLTLGVKSKNGGLFGWFQHNRDKVRFVVHVKSLSVLEMSGSAQAKIATFTQPDFYLEGSGASQITVGTFEGKTIKVNLSGASQAKFEQIHAQNHDYDISGASNVEIQQAGEADMVSANVSGASNLRTKLLTTKEANVEASGASNIELRVTENLVAESTGASNIRYYGNPRAKVESSGAGNVNSLND